MQLVVGDIVEGKVTGITNFGVFVEFGAGKTGMVHISEIAPTFVNEINDFVKVGDTVKVKVLSLGDGKKISLSIKQANVPKKSAKPVELDWNSEKTTKANSTNFEDKISKFLKDSEEKLQDVKKHQEFKGKNSKIS